MKSKIKNIMLFILALIATGMSNSNAQVSVLIDPTGDGGFETGSTFAANGWILAAGVATNQWFVGNVAGPQSGNNCAYISSNGFGTTYDYNVTSASTVYFYRDIAFPATKTRITMVINWKNVGEAFFDRPMVAYTDPANTPVVNDYMSSTFPLYATSITSNANAFGISTGNGTAYSSMTVLLPSSFAGTTRRIMFGWQNNATGGSGQPAAFDNISLTAEPPINCTVNTNGGLWSDPATWVGGLYPSANDNVIIPDGVTLTADGVGNSAAPGAICNNLTVGGGASGTLNFISAFNALAISGNLTVNNGGKLNGFIQSATPGPNSGGGVTVNVAGNININSGGSICMAHSAAILNMNGTSPQSINGPGTFLGGIVRNLRIANPTSLTLNVPIIINHTSAGTGLEHYAGNLITNGNLTLDATACLVNNPAVSQSIFTAVVSGMGVGYGSAPTLTCGIPYTNGRPVTATNVIAYGGNIYSVTVAGVLGATPPNPVAGPQANGTATLYLSGTAATAVPNYDPVTQKVRSVTITNGGSGYHVNQTLIFNNPWGANMVATLGDTIVSGTNMYTVTTAGTFGGTAPSHITGTAVNGTASLTYIGTPAVVTGIVLQSIQGSQVGVFYDRNGGTSVTGSITINNSQTIGGMTVTNTSATNLNYSSAPTVGFGVPVRTFLTTATGSGYTGATVVFAYPSGTMVTAPTATATVVNGKVTSIVITGTGGVFTGGTGTVTVTINPTAGGSGATVADLSIPVATATVTDGMISGFTMTQFGADYVTQPTITLGTVAGAIPPTAANVTCRTGLYTVRYQTNTAVWPNVGPVTEGTEIPANRKLFALTINNPKHLTLNDNLELTANSSALSCSAGIINFSGANKTITCSNPAYNGGFTSSSATIPSFVNGIETLTSPGGSVTKNFAVGRTISITTGTGSGAAGTGSDITSISAQTDIPPTGTFTAGTYTFTGFRTYNVIRNGTQYGTGPTAAVQWNVEDNLASDNANLHVAQATATSGPWTVRTTAGTAGILPITGTKTTATGAPGPIVYNTSDFFTFATSFTPPPALNYLITRTTGNTYNSIAATGSSIPSWAGVNPSTETQRSNSTSLAGTTFQYQGVPVTGFVLGIDGYFTFNTAHTSNLSTIQLAASPFSPIISALAPFWANISCTGTYGSAAVRDASIKYKIDGTLGSGTAIITIEWIHMTGSQNPVQNTGSDLNFQIKLFESDNHIEFNYGLMEGFTGANQTPWSYTTGMNGSLVQAFPAPGQVLALQEHDENTTNFSNEKAHVANAGTNVLRTLPACYSSYIFTPGAQVPYVPGSIIPVNDEPAGAVVLTELPSPPSDYCGAKYTSYGATATVTPASCTGNADDDVWFKFTATDPETAVKVVSSGGYDAAIQVFDAALNLLSPTVCKDTSNDGRIEIAKISGLTLSNDYYVRVYHKLGGTQATATATVDNGSISSVTITNPGSGYALPSAGSFGTPRIRVSGGGGNNGVLSAVTSGTNAAPGSLTGITISSVGTGYTSAPTITIDPPSAGLSGDFAIAVYSNSPPPSNDGICGPAISLTVGSATCNAVAGTTFGATQSGGIPVCTGVADDDVFYSFVAPAGGNPVSIQVQGSASFDAVMQVLSSNNNLCSGTLTSFSCSDATLSGGLETITTTSLVAGNTYFVRVYHANTGAGSGAFTICVFESGPPCPVQTALPDGSLAYIGGTTLKWNASTGATGYDVYFSTVQADVISGAPAALVSSNQAGLTYATGALTNATVYYWRVDARNAVGPSVGCTVRSFTGTTDLIIGSDATVCSGNFYDSGGPSGPYQDNENSTTTICPSTVGTVSSVTFTGFSLSLLLNDALSIYNGPTIASPQFAGSPFVGFPGPTGNTYTSTDNSGCITFRFTSDGNNNTGTGWAATVNCAIACSPSPTSPTDGGSLCELPNNTLSWPSNAGATGYDVYLDNTPNPTTLVVNNQNVLTYNTGALAAGVYYWKVVNRNGAIVCANPTIWSFTVRALPIPDAFSNAPICAGSTLTLFGDNLTSGQSTFNSWSWSGPNSFTSSVQNPSISNASPLNTGTYNLTVTNQWGCTSAAPASAIVAINPNPVLTIASQTNVSCNGELDGEVDIDATSGTSPFVFDLDGNPTLDGIYTGLGAGTYTANVIDDAGCEATSIIVTITEPDVLTVTAGSNTPVCAGTSLNLTSTPVGGTTAYGYAWTGPNGSVPAVQNPVINPATVADAGQYDLTITDANGCTATASQTVVVNTISTAPTSVTSDDPDNEICSGQNVLLTANGGVLGSSPGTSYKWYEGGCGTGSALGSASTLNVINPTAGSHTYYVRIEDACGNTTCSSITILVSGAPPGVVTGTFTGPSFACSGTVALVTVNPISGSNIHYSWNIGTNSSVVLFSTNIGGPFSPGPFSTPTNQVYAQFGTLGAGHSGYYVCVQGVNSCGSTTNRCLSIRGTVSGPGLIAPADPIACPNDVKNYTCGASTGATIYSWTLGGSATPITSGQGTTAVTVTFPPAFTTGQLCVTAALACGGSSTSPPRCMTITNTPAIPGTMAGPSKVCPGATGVAFSVPLVTGATGYNWTVPSGCTIATGTGSNAITVNFPTPYTGAPSICVTATGACATSVQRCKTVGTNIPSMPGNITGPNSNICNSTVQYSIANVSGATGYTWTSPAGTTISNGQGTTTILLSVSPTFTTGTLSVTANTSLCTPGSSTARTITIVGKPSTPGTITASPGAWCAGGFVNFSVAAATPVPTYTWFVANGTIDAGQGSNNIDVTWGAGAGNVNVTASNGCGASGTRSQSFSSSCREEEELSTTDHFAVYPNPAHDHVTVSIYVKEAAQFNIKLRDLSGRIILSENRNGSAGLNTYDMELKNFAKGLYTLEVQSADKSWKSKVVIQ